MFDLLLDVWTGTSCQATIAPSPGHFATGFSNESS
jgi:hypothetical protein